MKKITSILLLSAMLAQVSCGTESGQTDDSTVDTSETTTAAEIDKYQLPQVDFEGETSTFSYGKAHCYRLKKKTEMSSTTRFTSATAR